jgi:hypothetical protein
MIRLVHGSSGGEPIARRFSVPVEDPALSVELARAWAEGVLGWTDAQAVSYFPPGPHYHPVVEVPDEDALARMLDAWQRARLQVGR